MSQTRTQSMIEAWTNIVVGFVLNTIANFTLFPLFGWTITMRQNLAIGVIYTFISLARGYGLRRAFNRWHR